MSRVWFITLVVSLVLPTRVFAEPGVAKGDADAIKALKVVDLDGVQHTIGRGSSDTVGLVFLNTECPICNKYLPQLNTLAKTLDHSGTKFYGVLSDVNLSRKAALEYRTKYAVTFTLLFDASSDLASALKPTHTPEAFVISSDGTVQYRGRIDDSFASIARPNLHAKTHDLEDAIAAITNGRPVTLKQTEPVGCVYEGCGKTPLPSKITYTRDIAPILNTNCASCHHEGAIAPFSLTSFRDAAKRARQLATVTQKKYMPPWKAEEGFGHFAGERRLTERQIALIGAWAKAGAPEGDAADLPPAPKFTTNWQLGQPDMVVKMPEPFTVPAGGPDVYRAFVVPLNIPVDKYVVGVEFRAGAATVVHHCLLFLDDSGAARKLDERDPGPGFRSFGGLGFRPSGGLGGWAPGVQPAFLEDGTGRLLKANSDLVIQIHYHPDGKERVDQSSLAIYFAKKPIQRAAVSLMLVNRDIDIPAGKKDYTREIHVTLPADMRLIGITPHMHLLGKEMKITATLPNGKVEPLIWIRDWDFRWQDQYRYSQPVLLPKGTRLDVRAVYDNTADNPENPNDPPKRVTWGEQTTDEMCVAFLQFTITSPQEFVTMRQGIVSELKADHLAHRAQKWWEKLLKEDGK